MHIEPTSRCVLACPGCPRTWFSEKFNRPFPKHDLDLDALERFLDCESGKSVRSFLLSGNHGDPIYYPRLIEMVQRFRDRAFKISTNGSYMPEKFWNDLSDNLTHDDTVYFSLDGLEHDNHLYRRNSDWASIIAGIKIMARGPAKVVWKSIIFSYNQHEQDQMRSMANDLGIEFIAESTGYFGDESLRPTTEQLIRIDLLYEYSKESKDIDPKCHHGKMEFVSADGYYWPCCMISNSQTLYKTQLWKDRQQWKLDTQNLDQARQKVQFWAESVKHQGTDAPSPCKMHCKPGQNGYHWPTI